MPASSSAGRPRIPNPFADLVFPGRCTLAWSPEEVPVREDPADKEPGGGGEGDLVVVSDPRQVFAQLAGYVTGDERVRAARRGQS